MTEAGAWREQLTEGFQSLDDGVSGLSPQRPGAATQGALDLTMRWLLDVPVRSVNITPPQDPCLQRLDGHNASIFTGEPTAAPSCWGTAISGMTPRSPAVRKSG